MYSEQVLMSNNGKVFDFQEVLITTPDDQFYVILNINRDSALKQIESWRYGSVPLVGYSTLKGYFNYKVTDVIIVSEGLSKDCVVTFKDSYKAKVI